jgi:cytidylate kinase
MGYHVQALERSTEALARAQSHWRRSGQESWSAKPGFSIALTREAGVPGTSIAHQLGARLGWPVYDHELVEKIAGEMGLRVSLLDSIDQRRRSWLQEVAEQFMAVPNISDTTYVRHLVETILSLGAHGECIIVERGAAQILPRQSTLRVRLTGKLEDRVRAVSQRFNLSGREAVRKVEEVDRDRGRFIREFFQKDVADPASYDLLLNASTWSVSECADLIIDALHRLQQRMAVASS